MLGACAATRLDSWTWMRHLVRNSSLLGLSHVHRVHALLAVTHQETNFAELQNWWAGELILSFM